MNGLNTEYDSNGAYGANNYSLRLGMGNYYDGNGEYWSGAIKELRVWNYSRSENEVSNRLTKVFTSAENGLIGYFKYNPNNPSVLHDYSINANHGLFNGVTWIIE